MNKCFECAHHQICKLSEDFEDLEKSISQIKYQKDDFSVTVDCNHFFCGTILTPKSNATVQPIIDEIFLDTNNAISATDNTKYDFNLNNIEKKLKASSEASVK